jgi:hypothetical protein
MGQKVAYNSLTDDEDTLIANGKYLFTHKELSRILENPMLMS